MDEFLKRLEELKRNRQDHLNEVDLLRLMEYPDQLDTKIPTRVNSEMKAAFELLCKERGMSTSSALRFLIEKSIREWNI